MGVDFYICHYCQETFPDCGSYTHCGNCYNHWCSDECAEKEGWILPEDSDDYEDSTCSFCRREAVEDYELLEYIIDNTNFSKEEWTQYYLKGKK